MTKSEKKNNSRKTMSMSKKAQKHLTLTNVGAVAGTALGLGAIYKFGKHYKNNYMSYEKKMQRYVHSLIKNASNRVIHDNKSKPEDDLQLFKQELKTITDHFMDHYKPNTNFYNVFNEVLYEKKLRFSVYIMHELGELSNLPAPETILVSKETAQKLPSLTPLEARTEAVAKLGDALDQEVESRKDLPDRMVVNEAEVVHVKVEGDAPPFDAPPAVEAPVHQTIGKKPKGKKHNGKKGSERIIGADYYYSGGNRKKSIKKSIKKK
jgi:hypothetical protein